MKNKLLEAITISIQPGHRIHCTNCVHDDALTCLAEQEHMSRFNAMLTFGQGDIDKHPGQCSCPCHRSEVAR